MNWTSFLEGPFIANKFNIQNSQSTNFGLQNWQSTKFTIYKFRNLQNLLSTKSAIYNSSNLQRGCSVAQIQWHNWLRASISYEKVSRDNHPKFLGRTTNDDQYLPCQKRKGILLARDDHLHTVWKSPNMSQQHKVTQLFNP